MQDEFVKFQEYLNRLQANYRNTLRAFYVFESIEEMRAPNIVGKKFAKANVDVINNFKDFFVISRHALNFYFLIELAKILDNAKQSLHLNKLINYANSNEKELNVEAFKKANQGRAFLDELAERYSGVKKEDLIGISDKLEKTKRIREKLKDYRDQYLAHEDLKKKKISISQGEIVKILKLVGEILNLFSNKTNFSVTSYKFIKNDCRKDTKKIFEYLRKYKTKV